MAKLLTWIKTEDLHELCESIVKDVRTVNVAGMSFDNIVDPFSALFDVAINDIPFDDWLKNENLRKNQKTLQNKIGEFHQKILGKIKGWEDLGRGQIVDLRNQNKKIISEVKNKYNTVKGSDKPVIYDNLKKVLDMPQNKGFTGYYVTILAKHKINIPFTPSDNRTHKNRPNNKNIREIDGASFYELATGEPNALKNLYETLPFILADITGTNTKKIIDHHLFQELFTKAIE